MNIEQILSILNEDIVNKLRTAVEIGKWENGIALTPEQREISMQAVLIWEAENLPEEQRTGYIDRGTKQKDEQCDNHQPLHDEEIKLIKLS